MGLSAGRGGGGLGGALNAGNKRASETTNVIRLEKMKKMYCFIDLFTH